jgi:hypothetical protein
MNANYRSEVEINEVVNGFESCTTAKDGFPHRSHLTVAVHYLRNLPFDEATVKMREGLHRFLDHHEVDPEKYNETLTVFWMSMADQCLRELAPDLSAVEMTNKVIEKIGDSKLVFEYYSESCLQSAEARQSWKSPDLKALRC